MLNRSDEIGLFWLIPYVCGKDLCEVSCGLFINALYQKEDEEVPL